VYGGRAVSCASPIDAGVLADYWLATLSPHEEEAVEEHLLVCDDCGARLSETIALAEGVRSIAREGSLRLVVSETFLKRAEEEGLHVRQYAPPRGGKVECTITAEDDILVGRLAADLTGAKDVDLSICDGEGTEMLRLPDIPIAETRDGVIFQESSTLAKAAPSSVMIVRLLTRDDADAERILGEYTFDHKRTIP
jgi:hypothetical protein